MVRKANKRKKTVKKSLLKRQLIYSKGKAGVGLLLVVVIVGAVVMINGVFPKYSPTPPNQDNQYEIVTPSPYSQYNSLQLQTFNFKQCGSNTMLDFLVDESGSMMYQNKATNLTSALSVFANAFPPDGILGMQYFSSIDGYNLTWQPVLPINLYKNNKNQFLNAIAAYSPNGATPSKSAFEQLIKIFSDAKKNYPNKILNLIFISDGIPETESANQACSGGINGPLCEQAPGGPPGLCRCFDHNQDPTSIATTIKQLGVHIYTIGYVSTEDQKFQTSLTKLMQQVATTPSDFYPAPITNQITDILKNIVTKFCSEH